MLSFLISFFSCFGLLFTSFTIYMWLFFYKQLVWHFVMSMSQAKVICTALNPVVIYSVVKSFYLTW